MLWKKLINGTCCQVVALYCKYFLIIHCFWYTATFIHTARIQVCFIYKGYALQLLTQKVGTDPTGGRIAITIAWKQLLVLQLVARSKSLDQSHMAPVYTRNGISLKRDRVRDKKIQLHRHKVAVQNTMSLCSLLSSQRHTVTQLPLLEEYVPYFNSLCMVVFLASSACVQGSAAPGLARLGYWLRHRCKLRWCDLRGFSWEGWVRVLLNQLQFIPSCRGLVFSMS